MINNIFLSIFALLFSLNVNAALVATSVTGGSAVTQDASIVTLDIGTSATTSVSTSITFKNTGSTVESISSLLGADSSLFKISINRCSNVAANKTCQITVASSRAIQARVAPYILEIGTLDLSVLIKQNGLSEPPAPVENISMKFVPDTLAEIQFAQGVSSSTVSIEVLNDGNIAKIPSVLISSNPNASVFLVNRCSSSLPVGKKCSVSFKINAPAPGVTHNQVIQVLENSVLKDSISLVVKGPSSSKNLTINKLASSLSHGKIKVWVVNDPPVELDAQQSLTIPVTPGQNVRIAREGGTPQSELIWTPSNSGSSYEFSMPNQDLTVSIGVQCPQDYSVQNGSCLYSASRVASLVKNINTSTKGFLTASTTLDFINVHNKIYMYGAFDSSFSQNYKLYESDGTSSNTREITGYTDGIKKLFSFNGNGYFLRKSGQQFYQINNLGLQHIDSLQFNTGGVPMQFSGMDNLPHVMTGSSNLYYARWTEARDPDTWMFIEKSLEIYRVGYSSSPIATISSSHPAFSSYGEEYDYIPLSVMETSQGEVLFFEIRPMWGMPEKRFLFNMTNQNILEMLTDGDFDPVNNITSKIVSNGSYGIIQYEDTMNYSTTILKVNGATAEVIDSGGILMGNQLFKVNNDIFYPLRSMGNPGGYIKKINALGNPDIVVDLSSYPNGSLNMDQIFVQNNTVYFFGMDEWTYMPMLAKADLTSGVVSKIVDFTDYSNYVSGAFEAGGITYLAIRHQVSGFELWAMDNGVPVLVQDLMPGIDDGLVKTSFYSGMGEATVFDKLGFVNGSPIFLAKTIDSGVELRTVSGNVISEVKNLNSKENGTITYISTQSLVSSASINNKVVFVGADAQTGFSQLFSTDGSMSGTSKIADIITTASGGKISHLTKLNNNEALFVHTKSSRSDLWRTDGTSNGTVLIKSNLPNMVANGTIDRTEGGYGHLKIMLVKAGNKLIYGGFQTLVVSDGTPGGTSERPMPLSSLALSNSGVYSLKVFNGKAYFGAYKNVSNTTVNYLWEYDPNTDAINQVFSFTRNSANSQAHELINTLFFDNQDAYVSNIDLGQGKGLYKIVGGVATKVLSQGAQENFDPMFVRNGNLYHHHILGSVVSVRKLNLSNFQVISYTDAGSNFNLNKYSQDGVGGMYLYAGLNGSSSRKLYRVDLNTDSVTTVFTLANGGASSSGMTELWPSNGIMYLAFSGSHDLSTQNNINELWVSNGTKVGTVPVGNINPFTSFSQEGADGRVVVLGFINNGNTVIYAQDNGTTGGEIYKY